MKVYWGSEGIAPCSSALDRHELSASCPGQLMLPLHLEVALGTHWIGDWVGLRPSLPVVQSRNIPFLVGNQSPVIQPIA